MSEPHTHADDSVHQSGTGNVYISLDPSLIERAAGLLHRSGIVNGVAIALCVLLSLLVYRYTAEAEYQTLQFNLLRSCLQSAQCDVQRVLAQLEKEK